MVVVQLQVAGSSQQDYIQKVTAAAFFQTLHSLLSKPTVVFYNNTGMVLHFTEGFYCW